MYVDWSIELGTDGPVLDFPWASEVIGESRPPNADEAVRDQGGAPQSTLRYFDLKANPGLINELPEAHSSSELRKFLLRVNAADFPLQSAKCDHWFTQEVSEEEKVFGAACKYGSYVDLLFTSAEKQLSFAHHEEFAANLCDLLKSAPEMAASAEVMVRRCFYKVGAASADIEKDFQKHVGNAGGREEHASEDIADQNPDAPADGFYFTVYVSGFGETEAQSRNQWSIALILVQHALVQSCKSL